MSILHTAGLPVRRHSLLKRNPALGRAAFSDYYEYQHGPLASSQAGFRKYTIRYYQNHVEDLPDGPEPLFDGCTQSEQLVREDYSRGFFTEADYENVKDDEQYLFDIAGTVSILGVEEITADGAKTPYKVLLLTQLDRFDAATFAGAVRIAVNRLDVSTASALGFSKGSFSRDGLVEIWFDTADARRNAVAQMPVAALESDDPIMLPVREVLIFGPEKPWPDA